MWREPRGCDKIISKNIVQSQKAGFYMKDKIRNKNSISSHRNIQYYNIHYIDFQSPSEIFLNFGLQILFLTPNMPEAALKAPSLLIYL